MRGISTQNAELPPQSAESVVRRMRQSLGAGTDAELARALGLRESAPGNWRARDSVPYRQCAEIATGRGVSLDWLLLGRGPPRPGADQIGDAQASYGQRAPPVHPDDVRLGAICDWWRDWWATASEEERTWALVQLRRAIPESAEPVRRLIEGQRRPAVGAR